MSEEQNTDTNVEEFEAFDEAVETPGTEEARAEGTEEGEVLAFPALDDAPEVEVPPIRKLRDGDSYRAAGILPKIFGDENLRWAGQMGDPTFLWMAGISAALEHAPREIRLFVGDLIGVKPEKGRERFVEEDSKRQAREISAMRQWRRDRQEAEAEGEEALKAFLEENPDEPVVYKTKTPAEIDELVDNEVIAEMEDLPPGTTQTVLATLVEREDFLPFVTSSIRLYEAGRKVSSRFSTLSSRLSGSQKQS